MEHRDENPTAWHDPGLLPAYTGDGWGIWKAGRIDRLDLESIKALGNQLAGARLLVGRPGSTRCVPAVCVNELQNSVLARIQRQRRNVIIALFAILSPLFFGAFWQPSLLRVAIVFAMFPSLLLLDYWLSLSSIESLSERTLFLHWIHANRWGLYLWSSIGLIAGGTQLTAQRALGSESAAFHAYGVMYSDVFAGEYWRLLTGPFLHYSVGHFVINCVLLSLAGWITWPLFRSYSLMVFFVGNSLAAVIQMLWGGRLYDNFGGMSGGIYALFGLLAGACTADLRLCPRGFGILFGGVAVMAITYSEVLDPHAATTAHVAGLCFGLFTGVFWSIARARTA